MSLCCETWEAELNKANRRAQRWRRRALIAELRVEYYETVFHPHANAEEVLELKERLRQYEDGKPIV